ncbi:MAG: methyltransferase domain-containing protein, partial [Verrucomicrobiota bacterium]
WNERFVILTPRYGETKKNNLQLSYFFVANGFKVLRFDQTNHIGESDGSIDQFTLPGVVEDILSVVAYVDGYFEPEEIVLVTLSLSARCGIRACTQDSRISRLICLVGMVDMDKTLKSIYNRDIFGEFEKGAKWSKIDILGFEIEAANFYNSMVAADMQDLSGSLKDASRITIPVLHVFAERDQWVCREDVKAVISLCAQGEIFDLPLVGHEINENAGAAEIAFKAITEYAMQGLRIQNQGIMQPDKKVLLAQNKLERSRLKEALKITETEEHFWGGYLGKFGIIEEAKYYVEYFTKMAELLGANQPNDLIVDAGCGNGFYGISFLRALFLEIELKREFPKPVHYCGIDLTPGGLVRSYSRHSSELIELHRNHLAAVSGVGFSYRKINFDEVSEKELPFVDNSVNKICNSLVLSYLKKPYDLVKEFYRILKPGGVAVISSMKPGCDMTVLYHDSIAANYSEDNDRDAKVLLSAAGKIKLKQDSGVYSFFTLEELERFAFEAGFSKISGFRTFGDQANLIRVVK